MRPVLEEKIPGVSDKSGNVFLPQRLGIFNDLSAPPEAGSRPG